MAKIQFSMKGSDAVDYAAHELIGEIIAETGDEDAAQEAAEKFRAHFRYGEYLDVTYDTETDKLVLKSG